MTESSLPPQPDWELTELLDDLARRLDRIPKQWRIPSQDVEDLLSEATLQLFYKSRRRILDPEGELLKLVRDQCIAYWKKKREVLLDPAALDRLSSVSPNSPWNERYGSRSRREKLAENPSQRAVLATSPQLITLQLPDHRLVDEINKHPGLLRLMPWRDFEKLLAQILERLGYEVELSRGTKDGGVDVVAIKTLDFGPHRYLLQAKRWSHAVGVAPVRELLGNHHHYGASKSCLAVTSRFTSEAWHLAETHKWELELKDHDRILDLVKRAAEYTEPQTKF